MRKKGQKLFTPQEKKSILSLSIIFFFRMLGLFLILPVFSLLAQEELAGATPKLVGLAMGAYGLTAAFLQIPFGSWSDRIGRKPVIAVGICLFIAGSLWAAMANSIYEMIFARLLQGAGAISAPIFALIADSTRPEVRARANAVLGGSVGMSFGLAMFLSPFLGSWVGLSGIFWGITLMATTSLIVLIILVPNATEHVKAEAHEKTMVLLKRVWSITPLRTINLGAFVCSMGLSATFFMTPFLLQGAGWDKSDWWKIYLPMLLSGAVTMIPAAIFAEVKNKFREVMIAGTLLILTSFVLLFFVWEDGGFAVKMTAAFLFFMAFNMFEPIFPSLVSRMTTAETKGTASGMYNFSQFSGQFAGGVAAGFLFGNPLAILPAIVIFMAMLFLIKSIGFTNPPPRQKHHGEEVPEEGIIPDEGEAIVAITSPSATK